MSKRIDEAIKRGDRGQGRGGRCLVCGKSFDDCPHSQLDVSNAIEARKSQVANQKTQKSAKKSLAKAARETGEEIRQQHLHPWADRRVLEAIADSWDRFAEKLEEGGHHGR